MQTHSQTHTYTRNKSHEQRVSEKRKKGKQIKKQTPLILCRRQKSVNNHHHHQHHQVELDFFRWKFLNFCLTKRVGEEVNKTNPQQAIQGDHGESEKESIKLKRRQPHSLIQERAQRAARTIAKKREQERERDRENNANCHSQLCRRYCVNFV